MDKIREDFEKWFLEGNRLASLVKKDGRYIYAPQQFMWEAWQASRKALVVTLPDVCAFNLCDLLDKKEVIEHIRAAGITVKGEGDGRQS